MFDKTVSWSRAFGKEELEVVVVALLIASWMARQWAFMRGTSSYSGNGREVSPSNWGSARTRSLKIAGCVVWSGVEGWMPRC